MGRPKKVQEQPQEQPLPPKSELPALLAKAKAEGDMELVERILIACSEPRVG